MLEVRGEDEDLVEAASHYDVPALCVTREIYLLLALRELEFFNFHLALLVISQ